MLLEPPTHSMADPRRVEYKACAVAALQSFADCLSLAAGDEQSGELRKMGISAIKEVSGSGCLTHLLLFETCMVCRRKC